MPGRSYCAGMRLKNYLHQISPVLSTPHAARRLLRIFALVLLLGILGGVVLCLLPRCTTFASFYPMLILYCALYVPTLALGNSLSLTHLANAKVDFPRVKMLSAVGWIAAAWTWTRPADPALAPQRDDPVVTVFLLDNGFHTDLAVPRAALEARTGPLAEAVRSLPPGDPLEEFMPPNVWPTQIEGFRETGGHELFLESSHQLTHSRLSQMKLTSSSRETAAVGHCNEGFYVTELHW